VKGVRFPCTDRQGHISTAKWSYATGVRNYAADSCGASYRDRVSSTQGHHPVPLDDELYHKAGTVAILSPIKVMGRREIGHRHRPHCVHRIATHYTTEQLEEVHTRTTLYGRLWLGQQVKAASLPFGSAVQYRCTVGAGRIAVHICPLAIGDVRGRSVPQWVDTDPSGSLLYGDVSVHMQTDVRSVLSEQVERVCSDQ
jgi:hypothetical protein